MVIASAAAGAVSRGSFGRSTMSLTGGSAGMVTTETRDGSTIQVRDDAGTRVPVTLDGDHVTGLQIVVRRP
jgi:hypothetical protein